MRSTIYITLASALAMVIWARGPVKEDPDAGVPDLPSATIDAAVPSSGYRITGANWSTDRTQPVYVPPHQRHALKDQPRRKADAAARTHDLRTPLEETGLATTVRPGTVVSNPGREADLGMEVE